MKKILAFTCLLALMCVSWASAQTLVLHHADGTTTDISLSAATSITFSGSNLVVGSYSCPTADIVNITYQPNALQGDLNADGNVEVGDIMAIINIMAGSTQQAETAYLSCPDDKHPHMIDLGLPSGTKWACCNVGAGTPEGYGRYFAWGETGEKSTYLWNTYRYWNDSNGDGHVRDSELVDIGSDIAGTQYDAATANWGSPWRMPSLTQIQELLDNCTSTWTTQNNVDGQKFTGKNGGTIFLPAAGYRWNGDLNGAGSYGLYWSSTLNEGGPTYARGLVLASGGADWSDDGRYSGQSVRPVRKN